MVATVTIRKKDVESLGKYLIKDIYELLNDDYFRKTFPMEMCKARESFNEDLVFNEFQNYHYNLIKDGNSWKSIKENYDKSKFEEDLKSVTNKIKEGSLDIKVIFETLNNFELDMEIQEDLYYKNKAFLNLYHVINIDYTYL